MPLIHGICIPPFCYTITYNVANADAEIFDLRRNRVHANETAGVRQTGLFVQQVAAYKAKFANPVVQDCDGCRCVKPPNPLPPAPMLPEDIPPVAPRWQPRINGGMFTMHLGYCLPPGAWIRFPGKDWQTAGREQRPRGQLAMRKRRKKAPARRKA